MSDAAETIPGLAPARTPLGKRIVKALGEPGALDTPVAPLWASDAFKCARVIGFRLFGTPADGPDDWKPERRQRGRIIDGIVKRAILAMPGGRTDVHFDLLPDVPLGGVGEGLYDHPTLAAASVAVEAKAVSTKKLMGLRGNWRNRPAGPDAAYITQASFLALAERSQAVHIICADQDDPTRPLTEWLIGMHDPLPHLPVVVNRETGEVSADTPQGLAMREARRQANILAVVEQGTLPMRDVPSYGLVEHVPPPGDAGDPWVCRYCRFNETCRRLSAGEVPDYGRMVA